HLHVPPRRTVGGLQLDLDRRLGRHGDLGARLRRQRVADARHAARRPGRERSVAGGHPRVVHVVPTASAELRHRPVRDERAAVARPAPASRGGGAVTGFAPGPWLRACALFAAAGAVLAVVTGEAHLGAAHRIVAALVAPPLAALLAAAWLSHRRLVPAVLGSAALF